MIPLILVFLGGLVLTIGDLVMKKWVANSNSLLYIFGLAIYTVAMIFLSQSYKYKNIAVASLMLVIFNIITLLLVSWFFYQEKLSGMQIVGIFLGLMSITVLELK